MSVGFTLVYVKIRFPCFIPPCCRTFIIFDLHGVIPCYTPYMEQFEETMLGSFELKGHTFKKMRGIVVVLGVSMYAHG